MSDVIKGGYKCSCGWVGNSRQALYWHKKNACPNPFNDAALPPNDSATKAAMVPALPKEPAAAKVDEAEPKPKPKANIEPVDEPEEDEDEDEDETKFDGDSPEIPVVFIFAAVFVLMIISGLVIFREKIIEFFGKGKPPAYRVPDYD
jgi:hypothetical protein